MSQKASQMPHARLDEIAEAIAELEPQTISRVGQGTRLNADAQGKFHGLVLEAKSIVDDELPRFNDFSQQLHQVIHSTPSGLGCHETDIKNTRAVVEAAAKRIRSKGDQPQTPPGVAKPAYVTPSRIAELHAASSATWDTTRLVGLLRELNTAHAHDLHMATAMLVRTICNHVPPIFGSKNFSDVANNYTGGKSIKANLMHLDTSLRNIADAHLHAQISRKELLPSAAQVDFRQDLDVLIQEALRRLT